MGTTANTPFFSKSNKIGSTKWQFSRNPNVPRGYVLDMAYMPHLPNRWYAIALVKQLNAYSFRVYAYGSGPEASLEDAVRRLAGQAG
jgi:hypothetical protein